MLYDLNGFLKQSGSNLLINIPNIRLNKEFRVELNVILLDGIKKYNPQFVVFDFSAYSYFNDELLTFLTEFFYIINSLKIRLIVCGLSDEFYSVFIIKGLDSIITVLNDYQEVSRFTEMFQKCRNSFSDSLKDTTCKSLNPGASFVFQPV